MDNRPLLYLLAKEAFVRKVADHAYTQPELEKLWEEHGKMNPRFAQGGYKQFVSEMLGRKYTPPPGGGGGGGGARRPPPGGGTSGFGDFRGFDDFAQNMGGAHDEETLHGMWAEMQRQKARPWQQRHGGAMAGGALGGLATGAQGAMNANPEGWRGHINTIIDLIKEHTPLDLSAHRFNPSMKDRFMQGLSAAAPGAIRGAVGGAGAQGLYDMGNVLRAGIRR